MNKNILQIIKEIFVKFIIQKILPITMVLGVFLLLFSCSKGLFETQENVMGDDFDYTKKIQRYGHGYSSPLDFSEEDYAYIAKNYKIFTVEKRHAWAEEVYGGKQPNTEAATIGTAKKLKAINSDIKVLLYWNIILNHNLYESQLILKDHPEWIYGIHPGTNKPMYDLNKAEVQKWWVESVSAVINKGKLDGVFLDASPKVPPIMYSSLFKMIDLLRKNIGSDKIVIYNGFRVPRPETLQGGHDFIKHTSGVYVELFLHDPLTTKEEAAFLFDNLLQVEQAGKIIVARGAPSSDWFTTQESIKFQLASFLLFYGPNSYFIYNWDYNVSNGMLVDYPEYNLALGKSLGKAVRKGWVYTRKFENYTVTVDLNNKIANIKQN